MLVVKQKRNEDFGQNAFFTRLNVEQGLAQSQDIYRTKGTEDNHYYNDTCLVLPNNGCFNSEKTYYLRVTIKNNEEEEEESSILNQSLNIFLVLQKGNYFKDSTRPIQYLNAQAYSISLNSEHFLDIVFTPILDIYDRIVFKINRTNFDALREEEPRVINLVEGSIQLYQLNNLKETGQKYWKKMGVQARPGTLIVVNKEPIRIGRSGIYELNNGTKITSFMLTPSLNNTEDSFLVDYIYENEQ